MSVVTRQFRDGSWQASAGGMIGLGDSLLEALNDLANVFDTFLNEINEIKQLQEAQKPDVGILAEVDLVDDINPRENRNV